MLPLLAVLIFPEEWRIAATVIAVLVALAITGAMGARLGYSPILRATIRVVLGGAIALAAGIPAGSTRGHDGPRLAGSDGKHRRARCGRLPHNARAPATDERHEHIPRASRP